MISGSGSLVWDFWFEIFALKPLVSNLCADLFSSDRNLRFGIFALRPVVKNLWFGSFGLCASVYDLRYGILVWNLWCEISGFVSLVCDL